MIIIDKIRSNRTLILHRFLWWRKKWEQYQTHSGMSAMEKMKSPIKVLLLGLFFCISPVFALDIIKWPDGGISQANNDKYKLDVVTMAMEKTVGNFGPYKLQLVPVPVMTIMRAREVLRQGNEINIYTALTTNEWEQETIPVRIPIRRGILNYRLLLIHRNNLSTFANIESVDQLKRLKVGSPLGWATTGILKEEGFNVIRAKSLEGMFYMLDGGRFDYFILGLNEIFREQDKYKLKLETTIEPNLALNLAAPTYFFVAPKDKRLAKRIEAGLEIMVKDGSLRKIFNETYGEALAIANLKYRKIINVRNPTLPPLTPLNRKELWYDPFEAID